VEEKTFLIGGAVAVGAIVVLALIKQNRRNQLAYRNQPGLIDQPGVAANVGISQLILATTGGLSDAISGAFSRSRDLNDPGLESNDPADFPGMDYTYDNSNSYSTNYGAISSAPQATDQYYAGDDSGG
jgi:hypothetical protein